MQYKCEIDKTINDEGTTSYQIYYYHDIYDDWRLEVPFKLNKEQRKKHFETTESLEDAIKLIIGYGCVLCDFTTIKFE